MAALVLFVLWEKIILKKISIWKPVVAALAGLLTSAAHAVVIVDFEDVANGKFLQNNSLVSEGYSVAHAGSFAMVMANSGQGATDFSGDGTKRLISFNTSSISVSAASATPFDAIAFDGGESWVMQPHGWATQIQAIGHLAAGGTTSQTFNLDLIKNPITGMQHFVFDNSFHALNRLEFKGLGGNPEFSLDNVAVQVVPEPETYALMLAGLGAVAFMVRRKQARHSA